MDRSSNFHHLLIIILIPAVSFFCFSCISLRSGMEGKVVSAPSPHSQQVPVTVFFHFTHLEKENGFDVVPKIVQPRRGFRDLFRESMKGLSNVKSFTSFTDNDNDIDKFDRRTLRDSLKMSSDITIHLTFRKENSFPKHALASIVSYGTAAIVPMGYGWDYIVTADVYSHSGAKISSYNRTSSLTTWYQVLLLFVYPFFPSEAKIEEIYLESMQDIFAQIESEGVLSVR